MAEPNLPLRWTARALRGRRTSFAILVVSLVVVALAVTVGPAVSSSRASGDPGRPAPTSRPSHEGTAGAVPPSASGVVASPSAALDTDPTGPHATDGSSGTMNATLEHLVSLGQPIYCGAPTEPLVALTFDDGPGILTPLALHQLTTRGLPATFFLVGKLLAEPAFVDTAKREASLGMAFGDHTWNHVMLAGRSQQLFDSEIGRTRRAIARVTHRPVNLFRPPYGRHDAALDGYVRQQHMLEILWTIDSMDSQGATADEIYRTVRKSLSAGDIILMHDNRGTTESALPRILDLIAKRGLTPVTVPQLLTQDPPTDQQVRHHTCG